MSAMPKRQKLPKVKLPTEPPKPPPPSTREQVERYFLSSLTSKVERLDEDCKEWQERIAKADTAQRLVYDLDWSMTFLERAAERAVYTEALDALTAKDTKATMESLTEHATKEALDKAKYGSRSSSSPVSNLMSQCTGSAWAQLATELRNWGMSLKRADEFYGKPSPPPAPGPTDAQFAEEFGK